METRNRNVWIIAIVALVLLCCCAAIVVALLGGLAMVTIDSQQVVDWDMNPAQEAEQSVQQFDLGTRPTLQVDNFAGDLTIQASESDLTEVIIFFMVSEDNFMLCSC